jgi:Tol biopolymer transport system component
MSSFRSALAAVVSAPRRSALMPLATSLALMACSDNEPLARSTAPSSPSMAIVSGTQSKPTKIAFVIKYLSESFAIWSVNSDGTELLQLTSGNEPDDAPAWSPDRKKLVFTRGTGAGRDIMMINANGTHLTNMGVHGFNPKWSPDGKKILYHAWDPSDGSHNIFTMNVDGSNIARLTDDPGTETDPMYSADGQKISFMSDRSGNYELYVMNANGTSQTKITDCAAEGTFCWQPDWSPVPGDQRILYRIAYPVNKTRVINADGTGMTEVLGALSPFAAYPSWSPDATKVAFIAGLLGDNSQNVWTANLDGTGADRATFSPKDKRDPAWAR